MPDRIRQKIQEQTFFPWAWPGFLTNGTVRIGLFQGMFERKNRAHQLQFDHSTLKTAPAMLVGS